MSKNGLIYIVDSVYIIYILISERLLIKCLVAAIFV